MATRKVKDAQDKSSGELIYFRGHAAATYLNDGRTVEDVLCGDGDANNGCNTVTSVSSIPTSKRLCIANVSADGSFSLAETLSAGREIHVIVKNGSTGAVNVTIPSSSEYVNLSDDSYEIASGSYLEINVISDGTYMYVRVAGL